MFRPRTRQWASWLPRLMNGMSIGQAAMVGDQIRSLIAAGVQRDKNVQHDVDNDRTGKAADAGETVDAGDAAYPNQPTQNSNQIDHGLDRLSVWAYANVAGRDLAGPNAANVSATSRTRWHSAEPSAALIALLGSPPGDVATILCGGSLDLCGGSLDQGTGSMRENPDSDDSSPCEPRSTVGPLEQLQTLFSAARQEWFESGIELVIWNGDVNDSGDLQRDLGFRDLGILNYEILQILEPAADHQPRRPPEPFCLIADSPVAVNSALESAVRASYIDSLDCPAINDYRSVSQTLSGYRGSDSYSADHWFRIVDRQTGRDVGGLILGIHAVDERGRCAGEIVYLGLAPQCRGRGWGRRLVQSSVARLRDHGCDAVLVAFDDSNSPVAKIYRAEGFNRFYRQRLWFWHHRMLSEPAEAASDILPN